MSMLRAPVEGGINLLIDSVEAIQLDVNILKADGGNGGIKIKAKQFKCFRFFSTL